MSSADRKSQTMSANLSAFLAVAVLLSAVPAAAVSWEWSAMNTKVMDRSAAEAAGADASKIMSYSNRVTDSSAASASASPASSDRAAPASASPASSDPAEGTASGSTDDTEAAAPAMSGNNGARVAPWGNGLGASGTGNALFLDQLELSLEWIIILILSGVMIVILIGLFVFCCMFGANGAAKLSDEETVEVKLPQPKGAAKASGSNASASKKLNDLITSTVSSKDVPSKKL